VGEWQFRAVRGATQVDHDDRDEVLEASAELVAEVLYRNKLSSDDVISMLFTATPDLTSEFPAYAARKMGLTDVPLLCATEIAVPGAMPRVLRLDGARGDPSCPGPTCGTCTCAARRPCATDLPR